MQGLEREPNIFDTSTLAKLGIFNPMEQQLLSSILNGCAAVSSRSNLTIFQNFARTLKRKAMEPEPVHRQTAPTPHAPTVVTPVEKRTHTEVEVLTEKLRNHQATINDLTLKNSTTTREINNLRGMLQSKTKECLNLATDMNAVERCNDELMQRIRRVATDLIAAKEQNKQFTNSIRESEAIISSSISEIGTIKDSLEDDFSVEAHRLKRRIVMLNDQIHKSSQLKSFTDPMAGGLSVCPIPSRDGHIISLKTILNQWRSFAGDHEGDVNATFKSHPVGAHTSIASAEQVHLIREIANDIGIDLTTPIKVQYRGFNNTWCDFVFYEQLGILSRICKMIRAKITGKSEKIIVNNNMFLISIQLSSANDDNSAFTMHLELLDVSSAAPNPAFARIVVNDTSIFPDITFKSEEPSA